METNKEQEELVEELLVLNTIVQENPCGMNLGLMSALKEVVKSFIGKACIEGASREQVARYLGRDVRTITRWKDQYEDFPKSKHQGHKEISYDWIDVVRWKRKHVELFK